MDLRELSAVITQASEAIRRDEQFAVPILAARARKAARENPHDAPLTTASQVLTKMASDQRMWINRQQLNKLYDELYAPHTKLSEVFAEELDRGDLLQKPHVFQRAPDEGVSLNSDYEKVADPLLSNALQAAFDDDPSFKPYPGQVAQAAERSCLRQLNGLGVPPRKIDVFAGQSDLILCKATYETPKGQSYVLVPVEIKEGQALLPTMFVSEAGFTDMTRQGLEEHIISTAGGSYYVNGEQVLQTLSAAKNGISKVASDIELAAIKVMAEGQPAPHDPNGIVYQKLEEPVLDVDLPELPQDPEHVSFAERLTSADGQARQLFGNMAVDKGRKMIGRQMARLGYPKTQIRVDDISEDTIYFAVGIGTHAGLKVPVQISAGQAMPPTFIISAGNVRTFDKEGLSELTKNEVDGRMLAVSSPAYGLRPTELIQRVKEAVADGNLPKAEDAINVLGEVDPDAQRVAIAILMQGLNGDDEEAPTAKTASQEVRDVPYFMTHKVFFPDGV